MTEASTDTRPELSGKPPIPTESTAGSFSTAAAAAIAASNAPAPAMSIGPPALLATAPNDQVESISGEFCTEVERGTGCMSQDNLPNPPEAATMHQSVSMPIPPSPGRSLR